ncbi:hypothetical protein QBC39DRAFT_375306 [Podospora conica]|nr:hypothetical protein QBC39DRAFT_375306 [Schizothecium conicum]
MESSAPPPVPRPAVNLETELTCSICTDLLHNPLTLLDCLHTYCGACLKTWFAWQASSAESRDGDAIYTCPSCRDTVRDTKHDARVATLLDMFLSLNPERAKPPADVAEMDARYKRGEKVMPPRRAERSAAERRVEEEERRVVEGVQRVSLREVMEGGGRERGLGHQTSLRSLIGAEGGGRDLEREIEEFTRQIQEEGLLEGMDLDNIDLRRDEELRRRITEAYRRRFADIRERERREGRGREGGGGGREGGGRERSQGGGRERSQGGGRRSNASERSRPRAQTESSRPASRQGQGGGGGRSRPVSGSDEGERGRYPPSASASAHLEPGGGEQRRRRTPSGGRSATAPTTTAVSQGEVRTLAVRSQTDLAVRPSAGIIVADARSSSSPTTTAASNNLPFNARATGLGIITTHPTPDPGSDSDRSSNHRNNARQHHTPTGSLTPNPLTVSPRTPTSARTPTTSVSPSSRYHEPSITCRRCARPHIEYTLHFNCATCASGDWNICLACWRARLGCLHWFGFGQSAWVRFGKLHPAPTAVAPPHFLTANRYVPGGGGAGDRLQSGTFCCGCEAWTNGGYWRCDVCNEGEWGFCTGCVVGGRGCSGHGVLAMRYEGGEVGGFRAVGVRVGCRVCGRGVEAGEERFHCYECSAEAGTEGVEGGWDVCAGCYKGMVPGRVAVENGEGGWRRCLRGHRMVVERYERDKRGFEWRRRVKGLVGGRRLGMEKKGGKEGVERWFWEEGGRKMERLVAVDVKRSVGEGGFPMDGGDAPKAVARWAWYPAEGVVDELMFPKWAEIEEVRDENGEWCSGWYMGEEGLFPAPYVRMVEGKGATK